MKDFCVFTLCLTTGFVLPSICGLLLENAQLREEVEELEAELQSGVVVAQEELEMVCSVCGDKIFVPEGLPLVLPGPE